MSSVKDHWSAFRSPTFDVTGILGHCQQNMRCRDLELNVMDCTDVYGKKGLMKQCLTEYQDLMECLYHKKQVSIFVQIICYFYCPHWLTNFRCQPCHSCKPQWEKVWSSSIIPCNLELWSNNKVVDTWAGIYQNLWWSRYSRSYLKFVNISKIL